MIRSVDGRELLALSDELRDAYADVFGSPPWNEPPETAVKFLERLAFDVGRPGFRVVVASSGHAVEGFATGWTTPAEFPRDRAYGRVYDELGADRVSELLAGSLEVDELAVRPRSQGAGLGRQLLDRLVDGTPAWLLTDRDATGIVAFYRRVGWQEIPPRDPATSTVAVFLSPR